MQAELAGPGEEGLQRVLAGQMYGPQYMESGPVARRPVEPLALAEPLAPLAPSPQALSLAQPLARPLASLNLSAPATDLMGAMPAANLAPVPTMAQKLGPDLTPPGAVVTGFNQMPREQVVQQIAAGAANEPGLDLSVSANTLLPMYSGKVRSAGQKAAEAQAGRMMELNLQAAELEVAKTLETQPGLVEATILKNLVESMRASQEAGVLRDPQSAVLADRKSVV